MSFSFLSFCCISLVKILVDKERSRSLDFFGYYSMYRYYIVYFFMNPIGFNPLTFSSNWSYLF
uniref:Uncharacterized protein n=1 Tax=Rhizophora mucronata TaxID=61149 RepID=A0A2P2IK00_RHIMU